MVRPEHVLISTPIDRAVPAIVRAPAFGSKAFMSLNFSCAIFSQSFMVIFLPTLFLFGSAEPFASPAALRMRIGTGGVLVINVKERSE